MRRAGGCPRRGRPARDRLFRQRIGIGPAERRIGRRLLRPVVDQDRRVLGQPPRGDLYVHQGDPPPTAEALAPCREAQARYLGQDFNTRLDVQLWVAEDLSWYRCDVFVRNSTQARRATRPSTGR